jgi:hypothetical protein
MTINQHNYEAFFLDYLEGRLDTKTRTELEEFLLHNPSLKASTDGLEKISLQPENIVFENKTELYKLEFEKSKITTVNYSDYCIAFHEHILSETKQTELLNFIQRSPFYEEEMHRLGKVFLKPEENITYPDKNKLYHKTIKISSKIIHRMVVWGSAAAAILIGLLAYNGINKPNPNKINQTALIKTNIGKTHAKTAPPYKSDIAVYPVSKKKINVPKTKNSTLQITNNELSVIKAKDSSLHLLTPIKINRILAQSEEKQYELKRKINQLSITSGWSNTYRTQIQKTEESASTQKNGLLALAESGITKINELTGTNLELSHQTSETGKINSISFSTGFFGFYRKRSN